jgi:hypothetical protein
MGRPRKHIPFSAEEIDRMVYLYSQEGLTLPAIGATIREGVKIPHNMVRKAIMPLLVLRKRGGKRTSHAGAFSRNKKQIAEAINLYTVEHYSTLRIAALFHTHPPIVVRVLRENGIPLRPKHVGGERRNKDAIAIVNAAVRAGHLVRQPCEICGKTGRLPGSGIPAVIAHHSDYNLPLHIQWLCALHHRIWHQNYVAFRLGEGPNASAGPTNIAEGLERYGLTHQAQLDDDSPFLLHRRKDNEQQ